jgi:predicted DsbA family dithiol-disulfide isomerase
MADNIKIDVISDIVCPWCIIGYRRLEQALSEMELLGKVEIEWQPFELNPDMPAEGEDLQEHIARKYGSTPEETVRSRANMVNLGRELGFKFEFFDGKRIVNTRDAHILLDYAKECGLQTLLQVRMFEAYFSEGKDLSDRKILTQELQRVGLNVVEALARLNEDEARERVTSQEAYWQRLGVSSVPTIVFNQSTALTGAQPVEVYKQVLAGLIKQ